MGGTYAKEGDYLLPNVGGPETLQVGVWGERCCKYLQRIPKALYTAMLLGDTLNVHLAEVDKSASELFIRLVEQLKIRDGITEKRNSFAHYFLMITTQSSTSVAALAPPTNTKLSWTTIRRTPYS